jgi:hypothetical protein
MPFQTVIKPTKRRKSRRRTDGEDAAGCMISETEQDHGMMGSDHYTESIGSHDPVPPRYWKPPPEANSLLQTLNNFRYSAYIETRVRSDGNFRDLKAEVGGDGLVV